MSKSAQAKKIETELSTPEEGRKSFDREVFHLIGNSFESICALTRIQQREKKILQAEDTDKLLLHIQAISDVYAVMGEELRSGGTIELLVDGGVLIHKIFRRFARGDSQRFQFKSSESFMLSARNALALATILVELLHNAKKYAADKVELSVRNSTGAIQISIANSTLSDISSRVLEEGKRGGLQLVRLLARSNFKTVPKFVSGKGSVSVILDVA